VANEDSQLEIYKEATRIVKDIQEEVSNIQTMGRLDSKLNKMLNRIKADTKQLLKEIRSKVFHQTSIDDWGGD
tara:strand:+ start:502 stop:720 length:219 start_codon:yes stop_codon:yes gene_type:complete